MRAAVLTVVGPRDAVDGAGRHAAMPDGRLEGWFAEGDVRHTDCKVHHMGHVNGVHGGAVTDCTSMRDYRLCKDSGQ